MDEHEMKRWHCRREDLFPTKLPYSAVSVINQQLPALDAERADRALVAYSEAKPYKGFYMLKYMVWYERVGDGRKPFSTTGTAPKGAPPSDRTHGVDYADAERLEREAYARLPQSFIDECRRKYSEYGWPYASRGWRILCIEAYLGHDVEQYRVRPMMGSAGWEREERLKRESDERTRLRLETAVQARDVIIHKLKAQIAQLGGTVDAFA